jgi:hypothetical protein
MSSENSSGETKYDGSFSEESIEGRNNVVVKIGLVGDAQVLKYAVPWLPAAINQKPSTYTRSAKRR